MLHSFTGAGDGLYPNGLTIDQAGNLYGASSAGGSLSWGLIFRMQEKSSGWTLTPLYDFAGTANGDGWEPNGVVIGPAGRIYGTTYEGGTIGYGTVFSLSPPATFCRAVYCPWTETILHDFGAIGDGFYPASADLAFDQEGNVYGTTSSGGGGNCGEFGCGTVYQLSPTYGGWTETLLYRFEFGSDSEPQGGLVINSAGNLYGTAAAGGSGNSGTVFEMSFANGSWSKNTIFNLSYGTSGSFPASTLFLDSNGNLYGTTQIGGSGNGGTVFELTPSNGSWSIDVMQNLVGSGEGPRVALTCDASGNFYGATYSDGAYGYGNVFKLTETDGSWSYTSLHDFTGGSDGFGPSSKVLIDAQGNLYGSTMFGGTVNSSCSSGCGVVFKITP